MTNEVKPKCGTGETRALSSYFGHSAFRNVTPRANRYPGTCFTCGHRVEAGEGYAEKPRDGAWRVFH